jgi:hypothetical protein
MNKNLLAGSPVGRPIYLDSFQSLTQSGLIDRKKAAGRWKLETSRYGARNGELLVAGPDAKAPILSFDPQLKGGYTIFIDAYAWQSEQSCARPQPLQCLRAAGRRSAFHVFAGRARRAKLSGDVLQDA